MASSRNAWGIDVGNRALKAVRLSRDGDGFRIDDLELIEHEVPLSQSGDNREELVNRALAEFVSRHKTGSTPVGISVSGKQSFARFISLPPVEEKKIPEIVRFEAIQQIPFTLDDVEWSYQLFRQKAAGGDAAAAGEEEVQVGLFAMRKEAVNRYVAAFTDLNLNVQAVQMSAMALYNAMHFDGLLNETTLLVDVGADMTDLVVADGELLWHRSVPFGGNAFTEALMRALKSDFAHAEQEKRNAATSKYARQYFQAMRPVFTDLVAEIQRSVGFYVSQHKNSKVAKVIAAGGTMKLPGLQKFLHQNLNMPVVRVETFSATPPSDARLADLLKEEAGAFATAYGLAVQTLGEGKVVSSLLPGHIRREQVWREKAKWFAASAALFVAGAGVAVAGAYLPWRAYEGQEEDRQRVAQVLREAQALDQEWSSIETGGESARALIRNVRSLTQDRTVWPKVVEAVRAAVPPVPRFANDAERERYVAAKPRNERNVVRLEGWQSVYLADVGPLLGDTRRARFATEAPVVAATTEGEGGMGGMGFGGPPPGAGMNLPSYVRLPQFTMGPTGMPSSAMQMGSGGDVLELPAPPTQVVEAARGRPGFLLRIRGITTARDAQTALDEGFLAELLKSRFAQPGQPAPEFFVADAFMVKQSILGDNPERVQAMLRAHQERTRLLGGDAMPTAPAGGGGGTPFGGGFGAGEEFNPGGPGPAFRGGGTFPNIPRPPGLPPNVPWPPTGGTPAMPAAPAPGGMSTPDDPTPFLCPLTGEDMRQDSEFMVLAFVVIGPPPPAPPAGEAPADAP
ncbi:MAG: type IV pilus assembly protein PilM [Tepidisphaerales bacterium]